jgi:hypothetical protein
VGRPLGDYANTHTESNNVLQMINQDMTHDIGFYYLFMAVFVVWAAGKGYKRRQQARSERALIMSLKNIERKIGCESQEHVGSINKSIRDNLKRISGGGKK